MPESRLKADFFVSAIGLGCSSMSHGYSPATRDDAESLRVIQRAVDLGVTLFDTADVYGPFRNEELLGRALRPCHGQGRVKVATKCGLIADANGKLRRSARPEYLRTACEGSLRRLQVEAVDLYQLHRVDPAVPLVESWGALAELVTEGKVRGLGISHATPEELDEVNAVFPITAVQYELSIMAQQRAADVLPWCIKNDVGFLAFAPVGRGYMSGTVRHTLVTEDDSRSRDPRFSAEAMLINQKIIDGLHAIGERYDATPAQVAIAWTMAQGENVVPIPGTRHLRWLEENVAAAQLQLTAEDLAEIHDLPTAMGEMRWDKSRSDAVGQGTAPAGSAQA